MQHVSSCRHHHHPVHHVVLRDVFPIQYSFVVPSLDYKVAAHSRETNGNSNGCSTSILVGMNRSLLLLSVIGSRVPGWLNMLFSVLYPRWQMRREAVAASPASAGGDATGPTIEEGKVGSKERDLLCLSFTMYVNIRGPQRITITSQKTEGQAKRVFHTACCGASKLIFFVTAVDQSPVEVHSSLPPRCSRKPSISRPFL